MPFSEMNFLSHHFFYANEDPYHNLGLILPDLSRSAIGRRKIELMGENHTQELIAIQKGCEKHYEADDWFHHCEYFTSLSSIIDRAISAEKGKGLFQLQRSWFLAHILSEMILDRVIIDKDPKSLDHFYSDLHAVKIELISLFLLNAGKTDTVHFEKVYQGFCSSEFIRYYNTSQGMIESLNRLVQRTKQEAFSEEEIDYLLSKIDSWIQKGTEIEKPHQMVRL